MTTFYFYCNLYYISDENDKFSNYKNKLFTTIFVNRTRPKFFTMDYKEYFETVYDNGSVR